MPWQMIVNSMFITYHPQWVQAAFAASLVFIHIFYSSLQPCSWEPIGEFHLCPLVLHTHLYSVACTFGKGWPLWAEEGLLHMEDYAVCLSFIQRCWQRQESPIWFICEYPNDFLFFSIEWCLHTGHLDTPTAPTTWQLRASIQPAGCPSQHTSGPTDHKATKSISMPWTLDWNVWLEAWKKGTLAQWWWGWFIRHVKATSISLHGQFFQVRFLYISHFPD